MNFKKTLLAMAITATASTAALADIKIGVSLALTGAPAPVWASRCKNN